MVTYYLNKRQIDKAFDYLFCKNVLPVSSVVFAIFIMISAVYLGLGIGNGDKTCLNYAYIVISLSAVVLILTLVSWLMMRRNANINYKDRYVNGLIEINLTFSDDKIILFSKNGDVTNLTYDGLNRFYDSKEVVILRFDKRYLFVAKQQDCTDQFIAFLKDKWNEKKKQK